MYLIPFGATIGGTSSRLEPLICNIGTRKRESSRAKRQKAARFRRQVTANPSLFAPKSGRKEYQNGKKLETADQHGKRAYPDFEIVKHAEIRGWTHLIQARTHVVDAGDDRAECANNVEPGQQQQERQPHDRCAVDEHEREHRENHIVLDHRVVAVSYTHLTLPTSDLV